LIFSGFTRHFVSSPPARILRLAALEVNPHRAGYGIITAIMRRLVSLLISAALLTGGALAAAPLQSQSTPAQATQTKEVADYVTRTGKKYHRDGCPRP